ncbi:MAG TPA: PEP-CTERM sorting domain-containing protein [Tepidisphaeraceae bacterium]|jgi:hypothetical protein
MRQKKLFALSAALVAILPVMYGSSASAAAVPISSVYAGGAGSYEIAGTVSSVLNVSATANTFTVTDASGSALAYGIPLTTYTAKAGDVIDLTATDSPYQGAPELVSSGFTVNSLTTPGTPVAPTVLSIPDFNASGNGTVSVVPYAESLVELDNVSFQTPPASIVTNTTYTIQDSSGNTTKFYGYKSDSAVLAAVTAANLANPLGFSGTYDIVGYADGYFGAPEIYPLSITAVPEPASLGLLAFGGFSLLARRRAR